MKSRPWCRVDPSIREMSCVGNTVIRTTYYKTVAFVLSAKLAGIAGCLYAGYLGSLYPSNVQVHKSIEILVMVVLAAWVRLHGSVNFRDGADHPAGAAAFVLMITAWSSNAGAGPS